MSVHLLTCISSYLLFCSSAHTQSYSSEVFTYPIMCIAPKKEMQVKHEVVDGVDCEVMVEVLVENPIKQLFLFGGAHD